jgi:transposase InsO family protein
MADEQRPEEVQRWTAKRRVALVISLLKGETTTAEAARRHGLKLAEVEDWRERFLVRSDNGLIFQSRRFRAACRDYRLRQEFITPYTPSRTASSNASFVASRKSASGGITSPASPKPAQLSLTGSNGITPNGPIRLSAIAARDNFARYNLNSSLDIGVALHLRLEWHAALPPFVVYEKDSALPYPTTRPHASVGI